MSQKYTDMKLLRIFRLALQSENVDLRDSIISYLAQAELPGAADVIRDYMDSEPLDWLRDYASKVMQHLRMIEQGLSSHPPGRASHREIVDLPTLKRRGE